MIELDDTNLRRLQLIELELLVEVDRICKKCGIKYIIYAGTLLGAVRHAGFIPWDDDADVAFLRPEYEKFRVACEKELDTDRFYFQDHRNTLGYRWGYGKLRRKNTLFLRENQEYMPYEQGIFIDLFPMDGVPANYLLRSIHCFQCFCIRKVLWSKVGRDADKSTIKRFIYRMLNKIPDRKIFGVYESLIERSNRIDAEMVRILTFPTATKDFGYFKKWFENTEVIEFENIEFSGSANPVQFLTFAYGDFMELPPKEKRKVHPVSELKLL